MNYETTQSVPNTFECFYYSVGWDWEGGGDWGLGGWRATCKWGCQRKGLRIYARSFIFLIRIRPLCCKVFWPSSTIYITVDLRVNMCFAQTQCFKGCTYIVVSGTLFQATKRSVYTDARNKDRLFALMMYESPFFVSLHTLNESCYCTPNAIPWHPESAIAQWIKECNS